MSLKKNSLRLILSKHINSYFLFSYDTLQGLMFVCNTISELRFCVCCHLVIFEKSFVFMKIILVSLIFRTHYRIAKMLPATGKWKVPLTQTSYESNFKTLKKAKDRQDVRPRNLEIKLEITCCSYLKDTRSGIMV